MIPTLLAFVALCFALYLLSRSTYCISALVLLSVSIVCSQAAIGAEPVSFAALAHRQPAYQSAPVSFQALAKRQLAKPAPSQPAVAVTNPAPKASGSWKWQQSCRGGRCVWTPVYVP